jgi:ribosome-associated translation inhibitor RaiA
MPLELNIVSRDFKLLPAVEAQIREKAASLDTYYDRISHCEVAVTAPAIHHHHHGGPFTVRVRLTVPGAELIADHQAEEELPQAVREAFDAIRRQLEDHARRQRGAVKTHHPSAKG